MKLHPHFLEKQFDNGNFCIVQPKTFASLISLVEFLYVLISLVKLRELVILTFFDCWVSHIIYINCLFSLMSSTKTGFLNRSTFV